MSFKNKAELVAFIKSQTKIELSNDASDMFNNKRNVLYTKIGRDDKYSVMPLLNKCGIRYEAHTNNNYFVFVR